MKLCKRILALACAALLLVTCVACVDKTEDVKKSFEDAGWIVETADTNNKGMIDMYAVLNLTQDQILALKDHEVLVATNNADLTDRAVIVKCESASDIETLLTTTAEDGTESKAQYDTAKENGWIVGNCLILTKSDAAIEIFKKA